ncbi:taperin [Hemiscyllium ocellatum]|uniref:taperin n=1 Tax=Hemiscyllium ocellatum TaxID=170820 RepID=UPI002965D001|nr:taperin [Hemiscyllium ocellatum]
MSVSEERPLSPPRSPLQAPRQQQQEEEQAAAASGLGVRMPAWKREILERRKAKLAGPAADGRSCVPSRAASHSNRAELEASPGPEGGGPASEAGGSVLLESIAPVQENPFIQRERRRRRRQGAGSQSPGPGGGGGPGPGPARDQDAAKPLQQLLELYSHMPGVRTIQADNIIIIESDPDYFSEPGSPARSQPQAQAQARARAVEQLLSRPGHGTVAEIRAAEVLVYDGTLSRSEENLSSLGGGGGDAGPPGPLHGKVSRLLEKFDRNYVKPSRSRSTENLLDGFSPARDRDRPRKPLLLPKPLSVRQPGQGPTSPGPRSPGPHRDCLSPPCQPKPFPLSSPVRCSGPPSPGRTPPASSSASVHSQWDAQLAASDRTETEGRPFSVSSYRKQSESGPAAGHLRQKEATPSHTPAHQNGKSKDRIIENKVMENGRPDLDVMRTDSFSVNGGEMDSEDASELGSGRVPYSVSAANSEVSNVCVVDQRKASKLSPERHQPPAADASKSLPANSSATPSGKMNQDHKVAGSAKVTPNQCNSVSASTSLNDSFEIIPATPPDVSSIPKDDIQARALANLKKQSKNSFVVIPKKRVGASVASSEASDCKEVNHESCEKPKIENGASNASNSETQTDWVSAVSLDRMSPSDHEQSNEGKLLFGEPPLPKADPKPKEKEAVDKPTSGSNYEVSSKHMNAPISIEEERTSLLPTPMSEAEQEAESTVTLIKVSARNDDLPITNIDDILGTGEKETPKQPSRAKSAAAKDELPEERAGGLLHPFVQRKSGNTFTVVPQRKPASRAQQTSVDVNEVSPANGTDEQTVEDPEASLAKLGVLLKKRYPLAEEIQVIGGYLSLERSCLTKAGSTRKKMKISFNDSSLHTTFEYPSENSLIQEEESEESDNDEEEQSSTFFFPRPSYTSSPTTPSSPLRTNTVVSALTNYAPKHAMSFNTWQEQKLDESVSGRNNSLHSTESSTEDDMLTPADGSSHSDYSSEPALYF